MGGFRSFEDARTYVHTLGLKSVKEWYAWRKTSARPHDIPCLPNQTYASSGWLSYDDFLGYAEGKVTLRRSGSRARVLTRFAIDSSVRVDTYWLCIPAQSLPSLERPITSWLLSSSVHMRLLLLLLMLLSASYVASARSMFSLRRSGTGSELTDRECEMLNGKSEKHGAKEEEKRVSACFVLPKCRQSRGLWWLVKGAYFELLR